MKKELSIEFGSSSLRIFERNVGCVFSEPNVVVYKTVDGEETPVLFCKEAKEQEGKLPVNERLYSPIIKGILQDVQAQADILAYALENKYPKINKAQFRVILCVSCGCIPDEVNAFKQVLNLLGFKDYYIAFQPICVGQLSHYIKEPQMIVDCGAGKTDIAIVINNEILKGVKIDLGGDMMNVGVKQILKVDKNLITTNTIVEKLKTTIGSLFASDNAMIKIWAQNRTTLNSNTYPIIANEVNQSFIDCHDKIIMVIKAMLAESSPEIISSISQNGVLIAGDSARLIGLKKYYENQLKMKIKIMDMYGDAVVQGASMLFKHYNNNKSYLL